MTQVIVQPEMAEALQREASDNRKTAKMRLSMRQKTKDEIYAAAKAVGLSGPEYLRRLHGLAIGRTG